MAWSPCCSSWCYWSLCWWWCYFLSLGRLGPWLVYPPVSLPWRRLENDPPFSWGFPRTKPPRPVPSTIYRIFPQTSMASSGISQQINGSYAKIDGLGVGEITTQEIVSSVTHSKTMKVKKRIILAGYDTIWQVKMEEKIETSSGCGVSTTVWVSKSLHWPKDFPSICPENQNFTRSVNSENTKDTNTLW